MTSRRAAWVGLCFALALALPAHADVAPERPAPAKSAAPAQGSRPAKRPLSQRPVIVGLLAALFLIVAGAAGANDKNVPTR